MSKKNVVVGLGEIGSPILKLLSKTSLVTGYDINQSKIDRKKLTKSQKIKTSFLHICIPFSSKFNQNVIGLVKKFQPEVVVIHSTISPGTTKKLQSKLSIPVIYSATRGIHKRMLYDLKRYTKFFAIEPKAPKAKWAISEYTKLLKKCKVKSKQMSNPQSLELAKIVVDTSYYGWLINYAQISKMIADKYKVDYDEMWTFSDEIQKFLGNRPKMFPGFIGGHCVIDNLPLMNESSLNIIREINSDYAKILKKRRLKKK